MQAELAHIQAQIGELSDLRESYAKVIPHMRAQVSILDEPLSATMTIHDWLVFLAQRDGGVLRTAEAIIELVDRGVCATKDNANDNVYSCLVRSSRFKKIEKGLYQLVNETPAPDDPPPPPPIDDLLAPREPVDSGGLSAVLAHGYIPPAPVARP